MPTTEVYVIAVLSLWISTLLIDYILSKYDELTVSFRDYKYPEVSWR